jgi:hypothetical protein
MSRFLATLPENLGFYNLGTVESYPTGGSGPTAYGFTGVPGSTPLPPRPGDNLNSAIDIGSFDNVYRSLTIKNTHGGNSRIQTTFYTFSLDRTRSVQFVQDYSEFAYTSNTNRNTLIAIYKVEEGRHRRELPINDNGFVCSQASINYDEGDDTPSGDYNSTQLEPGEYVFLITNDIRYLETTYSITMQTSVTDWRYVAEAIIDRVDFDVVTKPVTASLDFGTVK